MLVLSRYIGQEIRIGDDIRIVITDIRGDSVRIGIDAPKDVAVHRKEVYEAIEAATNPDKEIVGSTSVVSARPVATPKSWHEEVVIGQVSPTADWWR